MFANKQDIKVSFFIQCYMFWFYQWVNHAMVWWYVYIISSLRIICSVSFLIYCFWLAFCFHAALQIVSAREWILQEKRNINLNGFAYFGCHFKSTLPQYKFNITSTFLLGLNASIGIIWTTESYFNQRPSLAYSGKFSSSTPFYLMFIII